MQSSKLIIITGAASGIGKKLTEELILKGHRLLLVDLNKESLNDFSAADSQVLCHVGDVSDQRFWLQLSDFLEHQDLEVSHLINSAGVIRPGFLLDYNLDDIDLHLDINAKGSILGTTILGRMMAKQGFGHIINISSLAGLAPVSGLSLYAASKFAIRGFSLAIAPELKKSGVDISVVCPDLVKTPMLELQLDYPEEAVLTFSGPEKILSPEDIVQVILKLMQKPKRLVCIPESRGFLSKIAGSWPGLAEIFRASLEKKGRKTIQRLRKT